MDLCIQSISDAFLVLSDTEKNLQGSMSAHDVAFITRRDPPIIARLYREIVECFINIPIAFIIVAVLFYFSTNISMSIIALIIMLMPLYMYVSIGARKYIL